MYCISGVFFCFFATSLHVKNIHYFDDCLRNLELHRHNLLLPHTHHSPPQVLSK